MRTVYVSDQTKEFDEIPEEIIMFDRLYLKGVPYERDDEAVDKEYVDTVFKNVTIENLISQLQPKNFPSFNADLINKEGENNFILRRVVRPDRYHKVKVDDAGRVVGGKTGKFTWEDKDVSTIYWSKFIWKRPHDITDYLPDLDTSRYLMKSENNLIPNKLTINNVVLSDADIVLNYEQVLEIFENFYGRGMGLINKEGVPFLANMEVGRPWIYQPNICYTINRDIGLDLMTHRKAPHEFSVYQDIMVVHKDKLIVGELVSIEGMHIPVVGYDLDDWGYIDSSRPIRDIIPKVPGYARPSITSNSYHSMPFIYRGSLYAVNAEGPSNGASTTHSLYRLKLNDDGSPSGTWTRLARLGTYYGWLHTACVIVGNHLFAVNGINVIRGTFDDEGNISKFERVYVVGQISEGSGESINGTPIRYGNDIYILHSNTGHYTILTIANDGGILKEQFIRSQETAPTTSIVKVVVIDGSIVYVGTIGKELVIYSREVKVDGYLGSFKELYRIKGIEITNRIELAVAKGMLYISTGDSLYSIEWPSGKNDYTFELLPEYSPDTCDLRENYAKEFKFRQWGGRPWINVEHTNDGRVATLGKVVYRHKSSIAVGHPPNIIANNDKIYSLRIGDRYSDGLKAVSKYWRVVNGEVKFPSNGGEEYPWIDEYPGEVNNHRSKAFIFNNRLYTAHNRNIKNYGSSIDGSVQTLQYIDLDSDGMPVGSWKVNKALIPLDMGHTITPILFGNKLYYFVPGGGDYCYGYINARGSVGEWFKPTNDMKLPLPGSGESKSGCGFVLGNYLYMIPGERDDGVKTSDYFRVEINSQGLAGKWERLSAPKQFNNSTKQTVVVGRRVFSVERDYTSYIDYWDIDDDGRIEYMSSLNERLVLDIQSGYKTWVPSVALIKDRMVVYDSRLLHVIEINAGKGDYEDELVV